MVRTVRVETIKCVFHSLIPLFIYMYGDGRRDGLIVGVRSLVAVVACAVFGPTLCSDFKLFFNYFKF
jgi:hypothetical protein